MMIKNLLFAAALLSLAFATSCATGGSGPCAVNCASVTVNSDVDVAALNVSFNVTATVQHSSQTAVTWAIQPTSCGSACGTLSNLTSTSATYTGPSSVPSNPSITIVATLQSDSSVSGSFGPIDIEPVTTVVTPATVSVGVGLTQQFTSVAFPDNAPQTFTWTCLAGGSPCAQFTQDPNISGLAYYTPVSNEECGNGCVQISSTPNIDSTGCTVDPKDFPCSAGKTTAIASRVSGTYAFRFSGFDKNGNQVLVAGTFTVATGGAISGFEDEITSSGLAQYSFSGGSYTPTSSDPNNSNNAGTLSLPTGVFPNQYQVVLDGAGDIQLLASDGAGDSGSGIAEPSSKNKFSQGANQTFAFGFTGADSTGNRVGYAGLLPTDGNGNVTSGLIDVNDNGNSTNSICNLNVAPCTVAGTYVQDGSISGLWHLTLTSPVTMHFDFFVANGSTNVNSPLTLYAVSTDSNPAVLGTFVYQNVATYNNATMNSTSVSALTGANANVSLTLGTPDGTSSTTGVTGACPGSNMGNFTGNFDQNNNGTELSVAAFPGSKQSPSPYTYVATNNNTGRYIFCMLGNPNASPVVLPIPFVLYASAANRGFLLDQSSSAVMTGTMNPQSAPKQGHGSFSASGLPGTYAVATNSNSSPGIASTAMNLTLTFPSNQTACTPPLVGCFQGTIYPPGTAGNAGGTYGVQSIGIGNMAFTAPSTENYIFYDVAGTNFFMIRDASKDTGVPSAILYLTQ